MHSYRITAGGSQGTAFFIAPDRVVTALHVVGYPSTREWRDEAIQLHAEGQALSLRPVAFDAECDLALLRPRRPQAVEPHALAVASPEDGARWRADGFPALQQGDALRLDGAVTRVAGELGPKALQLKVEQIQGDQDIGWAGVSGAPVLAAGRVVGVLTQELADNITFAASSWALRRLAWLSEQRAILEDTLSGEEAAGLDEAWDLQGLRAFVEGLRGRAGLDGLRAALAQGQPQGLSVAVIAPSEALGAHRAALVARLAGLPGVAEVLPLRAEVDADLPALERAQAVVALLGWTTEGQVGLRRALAHSGVFAFVDADEPPRRGLSRAQRAALDEALELMEEARAAVEFDSPEGAVDAALKALAPTLRAHAPDAELLLRPWEEAWLKDRVERWRGGDMSNLHGLMGTGAPARTQVYVPLRVQAGVFWEDSLGKLRAHGEEEDWEREIVEHERLVERTRPARDQLFLFPPEQNRQRHHPFAEAALSHPAARCAVLQGSAGAGKTVLLQHIAWTLAARHLQGPELDPGALDLRALRGGDARLPVPVLLKARELSEVLEQDQHRGRVSLLSAARAVHAALREVVPEPPSPEALREELRSGRLMLLLDALDEVPELAARGRLLRFLEQEAAGPGQLRALLSARPPADTGLLKPRPPLAHVALSPLDDDSRRRLVQRWQVFLGEPAAFTEGFLAALAGLAARGTSLEIRNPLILTAAVVVYKVREQKLPEDPAELHERLIDHLCSARARARTREGVALTPRQKRRLLEWVFLGMQQAGGTEWALQRAACALAADAELSVLVGQRSPDAARLLEELIEDTALLRLEPGEGGVLLRPAHRSFQEYLAAWGWVNARVQETTEGQIAPLLAGPRGRAPVEDPAWRRVLVFLAAVYGAPRAEALAETLLAWADGHGPRAVDDPDGLRLRVAEMLMDYPQHFPDGALLQRLRRLMAERYAEVGAGWAMLDRVAWLDALGVLGDPRFEGDPWVRIPGGSFVMGGDDEAYRAMPATRREVGPVVLAWRPVTVADYRRFVESPCYAEPAWWRWGGLLEELPMEPEGWAAQLQHPGRPVAGVSWVEAVAFCAWASRDDRARWRLKEGEVLDLPCEVEWEFVARGVSGRGFPWGEDPLRRGADAQANWGRSGLGARSPVGAFPAGAVLHGARPVEDLAGNVWEWCRDAWTDASPNRLAEPIDATPAWRSRVDRVVDTYGRTVNSDALRVFRGGSWFDHLPMFLRGAGAEGDFPERRGGNLGFRVVLRRSPELEP